jgi:hypothetical protein
LEWREPGVEIQVRKAKTTEMGRDECHIIQIYIGACRAPAEPLWVWTKRMPHIPEVGACRAFRAGWEGIV